MQRYRINYTWLIGVFVGGFVFAVAAFFVHRWQVTRNADTFITRAQKAEAEGDWIEAFDSYSKYVQLRKDDEETLVKLGDAANEVVQLKEATQEERSLAYGALDQTVRKTNNPSLRRKLAKFVIGFRPQDAIGHLEDLLRENENDPELNSLLVEAYYRAKNNDEVKNRAFKLIGYDREKGKFAEEIPSSRVEPDVFTILANILREQKKDRDLARQVINRMTEANSESAQAHLSKSRFWRQIGLKEKAEGERTKLIAEGDEGEEDDDEELLAKAEELLEQAEASLATAKESLDKAYELDPLDAAVLRQVGSVTMSMAEEVEKEAKKAEGEEQEKLAQQAKEYYSQAKSYFATGLKEYPDDLTFYQGIAIAERGNGDLEAALKVLDEGIRKFGERKSGDGATAHLTLIKIDLLFKEKDYAAIEKELERLTLLNSPALVPLIDYQRARISFDKQLWVQAARELKRVRPLLFERPNEQAAAGAMLGHAYEKQGIRDLALDAYDVVLNDHPDHAFARQRRDRLRRVRQPQQVSQGPNVDEIVDGILLLPEAEQDWSEVDKIIEELKKRHKLSSAKEKLLRARVLIKRGIYADAQALISQASKEDRDDIDVHYAAIMLLAADPERGPAYALKSLDKLEKKWGVSLRSKNQRANLLTQLNEEDLSQKLRELVADADDMTEPELAKMYTVIALKFEQVQKMDEAREFWRKASGLRPNNLPILMHMFDIAAQEQDDASMQAAQEDILKLVQSKNNPSYIVTEVKRIITVYGTQKDNAEKLAEARKLLDVALRERPEWEELHVLYGRLLILLNEDLELAMSHFDDAIKFGSKNASAIVIQTRLLAQQGLYAKALERMKLLSVKSRGRVLGKLEAEILTKTGDIRGGFLAARKFAETQPQNPQIQMWYSQLATTAGELEAAVEAMELALDVDNTNPDQWIQLVALYAQLKETEKVESSLREANLAVSAEYLPLLTAKSYELQGRWQNAERIYLAAYQQRLDDIAVAHRLAQFYLQWASQDILNNERATPYLNQILRAAYSGEASWQNPHVVFARSQSARLLAMKRDYQKSLLAERLLLQGTSVETLSETDLLQLVDILVDRRDPASLLKAKTHLANFQKQGRLQKKGMLQLADILSKTNDWDACQSLMLEAIAKYRTDPSVWSTYINLLIERDEYTSAKRYVDRLRELKPNNPLHIQFAAKIAAKQGDTARLRKLLSLLLPNLDGGLTDSQLQTMVNVANLATQNGDYELAEKLMRKYEERKPDDKLPLTEFLAMHGDPQEALDRMKQLFNEDIDKILALANRMNALRRDEFGDKYDQQIDAIIEAALRDDPDSVRRQLVRAEAYEAQQKNEKSIASYDNILATGDLAARTRAAAKNNLGFQLALLGQRLGEAEQMINEAMHTFGPVSDILDTRAAVYMAQKKYELAIEDLELATSADQDPLKFFHLAKAYILAGEGRAAQKAWKGALDRGFEKSMLSRLEKPGFDAIVQQIENFELQSAKL